MHINYDLIVDVQYTLELKYKIKIPNMTNYNFSRFCLRNHRMTKTMSTLILFILINDKFVSSNICTQEGYFFKILGKANLNRICIQINTVYRYIYDLFINFVLCNFKFYLLSLRVCDKHNLFSTLA